MFMFCEMMYPNVFRKIVEKQQIVTPKSIPVIVLMKTSKDSSVKKQANTEPPMHPDAFITPMSFIRPDIVKCTRQDVIIGAVRMFRMLMVRMYCEKML